VINVGLVGFGFAGRVFHAPIISAVPGLQLRAILQRSGNEAALRYPKAQVVKSMDELLAIDEIKLVVILRLTCSTIPCLNSACGRAETLLSISHSRQPVQRQRTLWIWPGSVAGCLPCTRTCDAMEISEQSVGWWRRAVWGA